MSTDGLGAVNSGKYEGSAKRSKTRSLKPFGFVAPEEFAPEALIVTAVACFHFLSISGHQLF